MLGVWGLGWEVWFNGMEVIQFIYFQQVGGLECCLVLGEIIYGFECLCMYLQNCDNVYDLVWIYGLDGQLVIYGDVYYQNEVEQSIYNFEYVDVDEMFYCFDVCECEVQKLVEVGLLLLVYEQVMKVSYIFNLFDVCCVISVIECQCYILCVCVLVQVVVKVYYEQCEKLGFLGVKKV